MKELKVGDVVWIFDENHRVYAPPKAGQRYSSGGPIYREHFIQREIVGETPRKWLISGGRSCFKNTLKGIWLTEEDVNKAAWIHENYYRISQLITSSTDYNALKQIENILSSKS